MASVNSTTNTAADIFASINGTSSSSKTTSATADMEDRFLTLLTTQLKNQDPLNPLDNAQVTSQLAQINTVNGIEKLNASLSKLLGAYDATQAMQSVGMIGKHVLVAGSNLTLSEGQAVGGIKLDGSADSVVLTIKDASGKVIQEQNLGSHAAGNFTFVWDGKNEAGDAVAAGNYSFSVEAKRGSEKVSATALQVGMVSAVTRSGSSFVLDLGDLGNYGFDSVQQII